MFSILFFASPWFAQSLCFSCYLVLFSPSNFAVCSSFFCRVCPLGLRPYILGIPSSPLKAHCNVRSLDDFLPSKCINVCLVFFAVFTSNLESKRPLWLRTYSCFIMTLMWKENLHGSVLLRLPPHPMLNVESRTPETPRGLLEDSSFQVQQEHPSLTSEGWKGWGCKLKTKQESLPHP